MQTIKNITKKPLNVPLPGGKRLFLGPGKTGQIGTKAVDHPPLVKLVEGGELEILGVGRSFASRDKKAGGGASAGQGHTPDKGIFRAGDG